MQTATTPTSRHNDAPLATVRRRTQIAAPRPACAKTHRGGAVRHTRMTSAMVALSTGRPVSGVLMGVHRPDGGHARRLEVTVA